MSKRGKNVQAVRRLNKLPASKVSQSSKKRAKKVLSIIEERGPLKGVKGAEAMGGTFLKVKDLSDVYGLSGNFDGIIVALSKSVIHKLRHSLKRLRTMKEKIIWSLPVIIQEEDLTLYEEVIAYLTSEGFNQWQLSNISHFHLINCKESRIVTSQYIHMLNSMAALTCEGLGCNRITLSVEE